MDNFYKQGQLYVYYNKFVVISKTKKIITPIISKNACSTLFKIALLDATGKECYKNKYDNLCIEWLQLDSLLVKEEDLVNYKKVAVIRNPLDRICSAYNTIGNGCNKEEFINKVINTLENFTTCDIDRHIASQFAQYDLQLIDEFIPIEYLDEYLYSIGIKTDRINVSRYTFNTNNKRLIELLNNDFKIYNEILNSDKCFKPSHLN